jgi:hypothetical protein
MKDKVTFHGLEAIGRGGCISLLNIGTLLSSLDNSRFSPSSSSQTRLLRSNDATSPLAATTSNTTGPVPASSRTNICREWALKQASKRNNVVIYAPLYEAVLDPPASGAVLSPGSSASIDAGIGALQVQPGDENDAEED